MTVDDARLILEFAFLLSLFALFWYLFRFVRGKDEDRKEDRP